MHDPEATPKARVLIVDDEDDQRAALAHLASSWGYEVETAKDGQDALEKLETFRAHVLLSDLNMPRLDGFGLLKQLSEDGGGPTAIVLTAFGTIENAIKTVHDLGAFWFLEKPVQASALKVLLARAAVQGRLESDVHTLQRELSRHGVLDQLVGQSKPMQDVFSLVRQMAPSKAAVLVTGESGTGKELVARAIHNLSPRKSNAFVAINCAALPESLMESELFGHEKGAFTGALQRRAGCFELADGGTLLLDEIGDMPAGTQAKLLRVLEDSKVRRLGGSSEIEVDVRVVAATNKVVDEAVAAGELREDLYYRLNVFHLHLAPLRERKDDIMPIAEALIERHNQKHDCRVVKIHPEVVEKLRLHRWPGNVRELRNQLERITLLLEGDEITPDHFVFASGAPSVRVVLQNDQIEVALPPMGLSLDHLEAAVLRKALEMCDYNVSRAARFLNISRQTLIYRLRKYSISSDPDE